MSRASNDKYYIKLKAAQLIYIERVSQKEVARLLNISRPTLARYMEEALEEGIVTIEIHDIHNAHSMLTLESAIKQKYNLLDVVIADCGTNASKADILDGIGAAAAQYVERILRNNMSIGVSWGKTIESFASHLTGNQSIQNFSVVSIVGGSLYWDSKYHSNTISQRILDKYPGKGYFLYAPTFASNTEQYKSLTSNPDIQSVLTQAKNVDIAIVGIGGQFSQYTALKQQITDLAGESFDTNSNLYGINSQFISADGEYLVSDTIYSDDSNARIAAQMNQLFIGLRLPDLKKIPKVLALAGGDFKLAPIRAALLNGYVNILITDLDTARYLMEDRPSA